MNIDYLSWAALAMMAVLIGVIVVLKKKKVDFGIQTILALVFGIIMGSVFKGHVSYLAVIGSIYVRLISALVIPLLFFSVISSIASLGDLKSLKSIGGKSIGWLTANTFTAAVLTLAISLFMGIGKGFITELPTDYVAKEVPSFLDTIISLFPKNIIAQAAEGEIVPIILFSALIAVALVSLSGREPEKAAAFKHFIDSGSSVIFEAIGYIIELTPFAVMALIANVVSKNSLEKLLPLLTVLIVAYVACILQTFVIEGILIRVFGKLNPIRFFKGIWPAQIVAFTSQSSVGTIPVTIAELKKLGVSERIASFTAGLGANLGMPGCAGVWPVLLAVFAVNSLNIPYTPLQYVFLVLIAVIVSVGTVGVPGTATITATAVFAAAGLPIEVIVIMTPISGIVDMARTACNVTGAATACLLVAESEKELDLNVYNGMGE